MTRLNLNYQLITAILISIFAIPSFANAQMAFVKGKVTLPDGSPAIGAVLSIKALQKNAVTSLEGKFILEDIPFGTYKIECSTLEAETMQKEIVVNKNPLFLHIKLNNRSDERLDEVIVVGKSKGRRMKEQGFAINAIDTKNVLSSNIDMNELLNRSSGVKVRQAGGTGSDVQYNINGLSGNSVRVFIDGVPIRNYGDSFSLSNIPPSMIERVEVYKGVVPAELADDALGGAVNVILKKSLSHSITTSYTYGSFNTNKWDISGNFRNNKNGLTFNGSAFYNSSDNDYKVWGDAVKVTNMETGRIENIKARRFNDAYSSKGINTSFGFTRVKWADDFTLGLLYSDMKKQIQHGATMEVVYGNRHTKQETYLAKLNYSKKNILPKLSLSANTSYSYTERLLVDTSSVMYSWLGKPMTDFEGNVVHWVKGGGEGGSATLANNMEKNFSSKMQLRYSFGVQNNLSLNVAYNGYTRDVDDPMLPLSDQLMMDTRKVEKAVSGLSYERKLFNEKLSFSAFYKHFYQKMSLTDPYLDIDNITNNKYSKSMSGDGYGGTMSYKLIPSLMITVSAEKALRLPTINELLGNTTNNIMPTYTLNPERSTNVNLGFMFGPLQINRHTISSNVNFFYRDVKDMIQKALTNPTDELYGYENLGKILSKGVDFEASYDYNKRLFVNYSISYLDARFNLKYDEYGKEYLHYKSRLRNMPYLTSNANASYLFKNLIQKGSELNFTYNMDYVHKFFLNWENFGSDNKATIPTQFVHDLGLTYTFPKRNIILGFDAKNIFDAQVYDNWALQKPGRAFFAKIRYNFN